MPTNKQSLKQLSGQKIAHLHDFFFRLVYANPLYAADLLSLAFSKKELSLFNLKTLKSEKDTYLAGVEEGILEERRTDLVFSIRLKNTRRKAHIFLLFEHKSYQDPKVFLQLLRYQTSIYSQDPYAVVLPIVVYHGKNAQWNGALNFQDSLKGLTPTLRRSFSGDLLNFRCRLLNIAGPDIDRKARGLTTRFVLLSLQKAWSLNDAVTEKCLRLGVQGPKELFWNTCEYIQRCNPRYNLSKLKRIAERILKKGENMKAIYEGFIEEGREEGREEGMEKGKKDTAVNLLKMGLEVEKIIKATGLSKKEVLALKKAA